MINDKIKLLLTQISQEKGRVCFLTGAGISAESGIRTFRGKDGYWTVGSDVYTPQEMATMKMFMESPEEVWMWYLSRFLVCRDSQPNTGHKAICAIEKSLGKYFTLVTQNIDGLHLRAGSSPDNCFEIHGSIRHMRCSDFFCGEFLNFPENSSLLGGDQDFGKVCHLLTCPQCGKVTRPHVLWFDEVYTEEYYRAHTAVERAVNSDLLIIAGTTLTTGLPDMIYRHFLDAGKPVIAIDIEEHDVLKPVEMSGGGFIKGLSGDILPQIAEFF